MQNRSVPASQFIRNSLMAGAISVTSLSLSCTVPNHQSLKSGNDEDNTVREITLEGPFQDLIYNRVEDIFNSEKGEYEAPYHDVQVTFEGAQYSASMRLRGGVRFCLSFPQIKLKLPKSHPIDGQREFKVITHGTYALDPSIPIHAPSCDNSFSEADWRESHRLENILYGLSADLLDFHLKTSKFDVRYRDPEHGIDLTERAYFVEDKDNAAKRYDMEAIAIKGLNGRHSWRADEDLPNSLLEDEAISYLTQEYARLQQEHPAWSKVELGKAVGTFQDLLAKPVFEDIQARAEARVDEVKLKIKQEQLAILASFDTKALAQAVLFNMLIQNSDWNVFGIAKRHSTSIKNVELLQDKQKKIFTIPYDFNESIWNYNSSRVTSPAEYKQMLLDFAADMRQNMDGFLIDAIKEQIPVFTSRLGSLESSTNYNDTMQARFKNFALALKDVESLLESRISISN